MVLRILESLRFGAPPRPAPELRDVLAITCTRYPWEDEDAWFELHLADGTGLGPRIPSRREGDTRTFLVPRGVPLWLTFEGRSAAASLDCIVWVCEELAAHPELDLALDLGERDHVTAEELLAIARAHPRLRCVTVPGAYPPRGRERPLRA